MRQSWAGRIFAVAVAGTIWAAYVQVAAAPTPVTAPRPSVEAMVERVQADLHWFRTEVPREADWWRDAYDTSSENLRMLQTLLATPGQAPPAG